MARSEFIGSQCLHCKGLWKSEDFERLEEVEADYFNEEEGVMYRGQFWRILCKLCGDKNLYLYSASPK